jgi:hypothetical protein
VDLKQLGWEVADWINLADDRAYLWALVNMVMFSYHKILGISLVTEQLIASQEGLWPMELLSSP